MRSDPEFQSEPISCGRAVVRPEWIDYNGHMNVGYYGVAFDILTEIFFDQKLDLGERYARRSGMGPFVVQAHHHYVDELRLDAEFEVRIQLIEHDAKRWRSFATMIRVEDGALAATQEQISLNVDLTARRAVALPQPQLAALSRLMDAHRDLPAPDRLGAPIGLRRPKSG